MGFYGYLATEISEQDIVYDLMDGWLDGLRIYMSCVNCNVYVTF